MKLSRILAFLLLLALIPLPYLPTAAADYSWATITAFELGDSTEAQHGTDGDYGAAIPMGDSFLSMAIVGNDAANTQSHVVYKCTLTSCPSNSAIGISSTTGTAGGRISKLSDTVAYGCVASSPSAAVAVSKTTNAGALWSTVTFAGTEPANCDVSTFDGSHYAVVWSNLTSDDWVVSMSSDGGNTFPVTYLVEANSVNMDESAGVAVAAFSDTEYVTLIWDSDTGNFNQCKTTNSGVTWTCTAGVITGAKTIMKEQFGTGYYFSWTARVTGDFAGFGTIATVNDNLAATNAYSVSDANTAVCTSDVAVFDADRAAVAFVLCTATAASQVLKIAETFDGGANWEVSDVATIACQLSTFAQNANAGIAYSPTGRLFAAFQFFVPDDTAACGGSDGDAVVERWYVAYASSTLAPGVKSTAAVTNLVGFDVDRTGSRAVARVNGGDDVYIWGAKTLGTQEEVETNCDLGFKEDAVAAKYGGELVMFLNCDVAGANQYLSIRDPGGDVPSADEFDGCTPGSADTECPYDITLAEPGWGQFDDLGQLGQIQDFPVDYSSRRDFQTGESNHFLAFGFTTQDPAAGNVGIATFVRRAGAADGNEEDAVGYSATPAEDFCVGLDGSQYYLAAVDTSESVKTWPVTFTLETFPQDDLVVDVGGSTPFGVAGAAGVDCGGGNIAFVAGTTLYWATREGTVLDTYNLVDISPRGVAISDEYDEDGEPCTTAPSATCFQKILAYKDDTDKILVFHGNTTGLELAGTLDVTVDGSFKALEIDGRANGAWLAQTGQVDYYEIFNLTNAGQQIGSPCVVDCEGDDADTGDGLFGGAGAAVGSAAGIGTFGGNLFLGILTIAAIAAGFFALSKGRVAGLILGVGVGTVLAWGLGFFTGGTVFVLVMMCGGGLYLFGRG